MDKEIDKIIELAKEYLENDEVDKGINYLYKHLEESNSYKNEIILLLSRYSILIMHSEQGLITKKEYESERLNIKNSFRKIVDQIQQKEINDNTYLEETTFSPYKIIISFIILILLVLLLIKIN